MGVERDNECILKLQVKAKNVARRFEVVMGQTCAICQCGEGEPSLETKKSREINTDRKGPFPYASDDEVPSRSVSSAEDELSGSPLNSLIERGDTAAFVEKAESLLDPTLGGIINWPKLADFAAMLPTRAKKKLWKGVFKEGFDENAHEPTQIKRVMKVVVMLFLTTVTILEYVQMSSKFQIYREQFNNTTVQPYNLSILLYYPLIVYR